MDGRAFVLGMDFKPITPRYIMRLELSTDGVLYFFWAGLTEMRASDQTNQEQLRTLNDWALGQLTAHMCALASEFYSRVDFFSSVDLGIAALGLDGAMSDSRHEFGALGRAPSEPYPSEYLRNVQLGAKQLSDDPVRAARELVGPLLELGRQCYRDVFKLADP